MQFASLLTYLLSTYEQRNQPLGDFYLKSERLGGGGYNEVLACTHKNDPHTPLAIRISCELPLKYRQRTEALLAHPKFHHPHILEYPYHFSVPMPQGVAIKTLGQFVVPEPELFCIVMPSCLPLRMRRWQEWEACAIMLQALEALHHAHTEVKTAHRDFKPENFLIKKQHCYLGDPCVPHILVADWDLCTDQAMARTSLGTDGFRAPETYYKDDYDPYLADSYSVGRTLEYLLSIRQLAPVQLSEPCRDFLQQMMARTPADRLSVTAAILHPLMKATRAMFDVCACAQVICDERGARNLPLTSLQQLHRYAFELFTSTKPKFLNVVVKQCRDENTAVVVERFRFARNRPVSTQVGHYSPYLLHAIMSSNGVPNGEIEFDQETDDVDVVAEDCIFVHQESQYPFHCFHEVFLKNILSTSTLSETIHSNYWAEGDWEEVHRSELEQPVPASVTVIHEQQLEAAEPVVVVEEEEEEGAEEGGVDSCSDRESVSTPSSVIHKPVSASQLDRQKLVQHFHLPADMEDLSVLLLGVCGADQVIRCTTRADTASLRSLRHE